MFLPGSPSGSIYDVNFDYVWSDLTWSYSLGLVTYYPSCLFSVGSCGLALEALADKAVALVQLIQHFEPFFGRLEGWECMEPENLLHVQSRSSLPEHCEYLKSATKATSEACNWSEVCCASPFG